MKAMFTSGHVTWTINTNLAIWQVLSTPFSVYKRGLRGYTFHGDVSHFNEVKILHLVDLHNKDFVQMKTFLLNSEKCQKAFSRFQTMLLRFQIVLSN